VIVGIDANSRGFAAVWDGGHRDVIVGDVASSETTMWASKCLARLLKRINVSEGDHVYMEASLVAGARNLQSTIKQAYLNGALQGVICATGATCHLVPPTTWKKVATGSGRATKEDVAATISTLRPDFFEQVAGNQDLLDAAAIHIYGQITLGGEREVAGESSLS
jgi:Holliday junction resolvasome RuvABC endonuclease subunit